jgi:hypothetical protein
MKITVQLILKEKYIIRFDQHRKNKLRNNNECMIRRNRTS